MDTVKVAARVDSFSLDYDEGADVLYVAFGQPRAALGVDIGDGMVLRYDEARQEIVGLTIIGLREKLARGLGSAD